jgi:hypothetical protein
MHKTLFSALMLLVAISAYGFDQMPSKWVPIGSSQYKGGEFLVDVAGIQVAGAIRRTWLKIIFSPHTEKLPHDKTWESSTISRDAFNCEEGTHRDESLTIYYEDGTSMVPPDAFPGPWKSVIPNSMADIEMKFVCAWKLE